MRWNHLPFAPLARYVGKVDVTLRQGWTQDASPARAVAICSGYNVRHVQRWVQEGLGLNAAEKVCYALGAHPLEVWGDEYWSVQRTPEDEGGMFCGRPLWYRASGRADFYGDPDPLCVQFREWMAA